LALAIEVEGAVQARQQIGMALPHHVVDGDQTDDATHAALHRGMQAQEAHVLGRAQIVAVVGVEALLGGREGGEHAVDGRAAPVGHVVHHGAVPLLRHRPRDEGGDEPEERRREIAAEALDGQALHDREAGAAVQQRPDARGRIATVRQLEVARPERGDGQGIRAKGLGRCRQLRPTLRRQREATVVRRHRGAGPGGRTGDLDVDHLALPFHVSRRSRDARRKIHWAYRAGATRAIAASSSSRPRSISASVTVRGGAMRIVPPDAPARTMLAERPSSSAVSVTASEIAAAERPPASVNSSPSKRPRPRTSPITTWRCRSWRRPAATPPPALRAFAASLSRRTISSTLSPTAAGSGSLTWVV